MQERGLGGIAGNFVLLELIFQLLEEGGLVIAEFGMNEVLGVEEDFPVRLPDTVGSHPFPPVPGILRSERDSWLEVHQAALDKQLRRTNGQLDPARQLAGAHL